MEIIVGCRRYYFLAPLPYADSVFAKVIYPDCLLIGFREAPGWLSWLSPTFAQVKISWLMSLPPQPPMSASVPKAQSLDPALDSVYPSVPPPLALSLSLSKINIKKKKDLGIIQ